MHSEPEDDFLVWHNTPILLENDFKQKQKNSVIYYHNKVSLFYSTLDQNSVKYYN